MPLLIAAADAAATAQEQPPPFHSTEGRRWRAERGNLIGGAWRANLGGGAAFHPPPPEPEPLSDADAALALFAAAATTEAQRARNVAAGESCMLEVAGDAAG